MGETMRERIARAMVAEGDNQCMDISDDGAIWLANAVLVEMREPTSEMVFAANCLTAKQIIMPGLVWQAMISAATKDPA